MALKERIEIDAAAIAAAVVFYLPGWKLQPPDPERSYRPYERVNLVDTEGRGIHFYGDSYNRRLSISGEFKQPYRPYDMYYGKGDDVPCTSITVNPTRSADKIAADILSRLIPGCDQAWADAEAQKAADDTRKELARANIRMLAKVCGEKDPTKKGHHQADRQSTTSRTESWYVDRFKIDSYKPERITITRDTDCTIAQALKIAAILTTK